MANKFRIVATCGDFFPGLKPDFLSGPEGIPHRFIFRRQSPNRKDKRQPGMTQSKGAQVMVVPSGSVMTAKGNSGISNQEASRPFRDRRTLQ